MQITGFGKLLFNSMDLDPVYCSLLAAGLREQQMARWLVTYWLFYHCGVASAASELSGEDYWAFITEAAWNKTQSPSGRWPRGTERRHFRGEAALGAVKALRSAYDKPEAMVDYLVSGKMDVRSIIDRVCNHKLFGPWIGFKVADMIDGVLKIKVDQSDVSVFLYRTPRESILANLPKLNLKGSVEEQLEGAMHWLKDELSDCYIPHKPKTPPDWFSLETVWCKHLSHMHGHYPPYKDIKEIRHGLEPWAKHYRTAKIFADCMPLLPRPSGELF